MQSQYDYAFAKRVIVALKSNDLFKVYRNKHIFFKEQDTVAKLQYG